MVSVILEVSKTIFDLILKRDEIKKEKKVAVSIFLNEVSEVLKDTADKLKKDEYPHGNCVILEKLSLKLEDELKGVIEEDELKNLVSQLLIASNIEKEFALRKEPETISEIEIASGEFRTMSMIIKLN